VTGQDGTWTIEDPTMIMHYNYTLIATFIDAFKQPESQILNVTISTPNQKIAFADFNYTEFVNASVSGTILSGSAPV
jgi:hypothetical protein